MQRDFITRSNDNFGAIAGWSFDHRWWVVALSLLMLAGSVVGAQLGAITSSRISAQRIRYLFSIIIFAGAIIVAAKLVVKLA